MNLNGTADVRHTTAAAPAHAGPEALMSMPEHSRVPISVLPEQWRQLFPYTYLNRMQSECFEAAFQSDHSIVISSPTGSGKTAVLEMAMARLFTTGAQASPTRSLAVYMAPLKSLCHERLLDWQRKLQPLNLKVVELTGDSSDETDERSVAAADCIVTTPEKWDAFSRFRRDAQGVVGRVGLLLVDEVHQITDPSRGPTLESVIARMMTISQGATSRNGLLSSVPSGPKAASHSSEARPA